MKKPKKNIKPIIKDKSGFTLVELLAVIVVLALLILIAGRAVFGQIDKARKNAFRTEVIDISTAAEELFTIQLSDGTTLATIPVDKEGVETSYNYACYTIADLKNEGSIKISNSKLYTGYVEVFKELAFTGNETKSEVVVSITDGKRYNINNYKLATVETETAKDIITGYVTKADACPDATAIAEYKTDGIPGT